MRRLLALGVLVLAAGVGNAQAATITFEDLAVPPGTISNFFAPDPDPVSGGFLFDHAADHYHLANANVLADNGSTYMGTDDLVGDDATTISQVGGAPFALTSIDIAEWIEPGSHATQIEVTGNLAGGGTLSALLTLDGIADGTGPLADFQTFTFGGAWAGLSSVTLHGIGSTSGSDAFAIDNVVVDPTAVPEPGTLSLLGLGSAYVFGRRRRNCR